MGNHSGISGYASYSDDDGHMVAGTDDSSVEGEELEEPSDAWPPAVFPDGSPAPDMADSSSNPDVGQGVPNTPVTEQLEHPPKGEDLIWFPIHEGFQDDTELIIFFPDDETRAIATMARDLQVVTTAHIHKMASMGAKFRSLNALTSSFKDIVSSGGVTKGILEVIKRLTSTHSSLEPIFGKNEVTEPFTVKPFHQASALVKRVPNSPAAEQLQLPPESEDLIWFPIHERFPDDSDLIILFPNDEIRAIATMARDLQVVTAAHLRIMASMGANFKPLNALTSSFKVILPSDSINDGILEVIKCLTSTHSSLEPIFGIDAVTEPEDSDEYFEQEIDIALRQWPSNKFGLYLTKLISRYTGMIPPGAYRGLEIADYCLATHPFLNPRELLFKESGGILLTRQEMSSLDKRDRVDAGVINAWARVLMEEWEHLLVKDRTCLELVEKEKLLSESQLVDRWHKWCHSNNIQSPKIPEMVFIPCYRMNHYNLLVINFKAKKLILIDTIFPRRNIIWEDFQVSAVASVFKLMEKLGVTEKPRLSEFEFKVMNPTSFGFINQIDSGVGVMHMMESYCKSGDSSLRRCLKEEHHLLRLKTDICIDIVMSRENLVKREVVYAAKKLFEENRNARIYPFDV